MENLQILCRKKKALHFVVWIRYLTELELALGKWFKLEHSLSIERLSQIRHISTLKSQNEIGRAHV